MVGDATSSRAPLLHGNYSASSLLRARPPPSRLRSTSRLRRLYDLPCSGDFAPGRGGLLQLLGMSLPPCCRFHPAEVKEPLRSDFGSPCCLRPPVAGSAFGATHFRGHIRVYFHYGPAARRLPEGDVVDRLQSLGFPPPCYPNYGASTLAPAGLSPAEHASLRWTHNRTCGFPASGFPTGFIARLSATTAAPASKTQHAEFPVEMAREETAAARAPALCVV